MKKDKNQKLSEEIVVKKKKNIILLTLVIVTLIIVLIYIGLSLKEASNLINKTESIINIGILSLFLLVFIFYLFSCINKSKDKSITIIGSLLLIIYSMFNIGLLKGYISLPKQDYVQDFTNKSLTEVVKWATSKNIQLKQIYESSDSIKEYNIISQDIKEGTLVKDVKELTIVISEGPNLEKEVILPSFVGKSVDDVIKFVDDNYLTGVDIQFIESDIERDNILEQDKSGAIKRNDKVNMKASIGLAEEIVPMNMKDLTGEDLFHASIWLKRYGFKYEVQYEYSSDVKKDYVISQSISAAEEVDPNTTTVVLTLSKGPKIVVPNLLEMTVDNITNWVIENNLKIEFIENYDDKVELGKVISANVNSGDEISEGTLISITISKGPLRMENFTSIADFRAWAEKYNVLYTEEYEFSDTVKSGNIISCSLKVGDIVKNNENISIKVSQGKSVTIPNFVGKSKSDISKTCSSIGLKCSFKYGGYSSSIEKDVATNQSKKSGSTVSQGSSVVITLSSGKAKSYSVVIQSSWLSPGDADATIKTLKSKLEAACPGVTFNFVKKTVNTGVGLITKDSPVKGGANTFTQGKTYTIYVGKS